MNHFFTRSRCCMLVGAFVFGFLLNASVTLLASERDSISLGKEFEYQWNLQLSLEPSDSCEALTTNSEEMPPAAQFLTYRLRGCVGSPGFALTFAQLRWECENCTIYSYRTRATVGGREVEGACTPCPSSDECDDSYDPNAD